MFALWYSWNLESGNSLHANPLGHAPGSHHPDRFVPGTPSSLPPTNFIHTQAHQPIPDLNSGRPHSSLDSNYTHKVYLYLQSQNSSDSTYFRPPYGTDSPVDKWQHWFRWWLQQSRLVRGGEYIRARAYYICVVPGLNYPPEPYSGIIGYRAAPRSGVRPAAVMAFSTNRTGPESSRASASHRFESTIEPSDNRHTSGEAIIGRCKQTGGNNEDRDNPLASPSRL
ncbi:hypothetical protein BD779DRAFT_1690352 [Infundibulicybe gibba]|nr:hypothetical protein BD779DRAFT_1690352 [Infundibulicybe gibba]